MKFGDEETAMDDLVRKADVIVDSRRTWFGLIWRIAVLEIVVLTAVSAIAVPDSGFVFLGQCGISLLVAVPLAFVWQGWAIRRRIKNARLVLGKES